MLAASTLCGVIAVAIVVELGRRPSARLAVETGVVLALFVALFVVLLAHPERTGDGRSLIAFVVLVGSVVEIVHLTREDVWSLLFIGAAVVAGARLRGLASVGGLLGLGGLTVWLVPSPVDDFAVIVAEVAVGALAGTLTLVDDLLDGLAATRPRLRPVSPESGHRRPVAPLEEILGHALALVGVKLEVARRQLASNPAAAGRELEEVDALVRRSLAALRDQRPGGVLRGFDSEVNRAREALADVGVVVDIDVEADSPLPGAAEEVFSRALRAGVADILHDRSATRASLRLERWRDGLALRIRDDRITTAPPLGTAPCPRPPSGPGVGRAVYGGGTDHRTEGVGPSDGGWRPDARRLARLAEQVSRCGGRVHVGRGPDGGQELVAWIVCPRPGSRSVGRSSDVEPAEPHTMREELGAVGLGRATNF